MNGIITYHPCYDEVATAPTLVSTHGFTRKPKQSHWKTLLLFVSVMFCSGVAAYSYMHHRSVIACVETMYALKSGQNATCDDPRSRIDIVSVNSNVTFMCKCNDHK